MEISALKIIQTCTHYSLHLLVPGLISWIFYKDTWKKSWLIFLSTMLVDLDHLLANPIFDPNRCSIGFHYLHSYIAITCYFISLFTVKNRTLKIVVLGIIFHMFTDYIDCILNSYINSFG